MPPVFELELQYQLLLLRRLAGHELANVDGGIPVVGSVRDRTRRLLAR